MIRHLLPHGEILRARVEAVYPTIADGSVTLVHSDGPYGLGKAAWDKVRDLAAWYRPHIAEWSRICAPSASVYVWNTAEGWAAIHPEIVGAGWTFRSLIVWNKGPAGCKAIFGAAQITEWPDVTEVCAMYQRNGGEDAAVAVLASELDRERRAAGLSRASIDARLGTSNVSQYWWQVRNWRLPTHEQWETLRAMAPGWFMEDWEKMRERERDARAQGVTFHLPPGVTNVWTAPKVQGADRLVGADGATLHPCQKPLLFAERILRASSRPGDLVLEPFGGTCRIAVANERLARFHPEEARRTLTTEQDEDGREYIAAAFRSLGGELGTPESAKEQVGLFGRAAA